MNKYPYITGYINGVFEHEKTTWDYVLLRPILLVFYFFLRMVVFPLKFIIHRTPYGFEGRCIDSALAFGTKYFATPEAAELLIRHAQIEPLLYRFILSTREQQTETATATSVKPSPHKKLNGIDGDYNIDSLQDIVDNNMTIGHDELSYEIVERFDRTSFLNNLEYIRSSKLQDHLQLSKKVLEENRQHSFRLLGPTNTVMLIVITITIFADLRTTIKALNSFGSDSVLLWCIKRIFAEDKEAMIDLDFYMQVYSNRGHYNSSAFFSDPSQYLYYHIVFDEYVYHLLQTRLPAPAAAA